MIAAIISVMLWMDVRLTLVTLLTVPLLWMATTWFRKGARKGYDMVRTRLARINAFLQEHFAGAQTVQIFNAETKSVNKFRAINTDYRKANIDTIFYYAVFFPLVDFIGAVGVALIIWYGGYRVCEHARHPCSRAAGRSSFISIRVFSFNPFARSPQVQTASSGAPLPTGFSDARSAGGDHAPRRAKSGLAAGQFNLKTLVCLQGRRWISRRSLQSQPDISRSTWATPAQAVNYTNLLMRFYDVQRGEFCSMALTCVIGI